MNEVKITWRLAITTLLTHITLAMPMTLAVFSLIMAMGFFAAVWSLGDMTAFWQQYQSYVITGLLFFHFAVSNVFAVKKLFRVPIAGSYRLALVKEEKFRKKSKNNRCKLDSNPLV